jgi:hypothetical protein
MVVQRVEDLRAPDIRSPYREVRVHIQVQTQVQIQVTVTVTSARTGRGARTRRKKKYSTAATTCTDKAQASGEMRDRHLSAGKRDQLLSRVRVPDADGLVVGGGRQAPVRSEAEVRDGGCVAFQLHGR